MAFPAPLLVLGFDPAAVSPRGPGLRLSRRLQREVNFSGVEEDTGAFPGVALAAPSSPGLFASFSVRA